MSSFSLVIFFEGFHTYQWGLRSHHQHTFHSSNQIHLDSGKENGYILMHQRFEIPPTFLPHIEEKNEGNKMLWKKSIFHWKWNLPTQLYTLRLKKPCQSWQNFWHSCAWWLAFLGTLLWPFVASPACLARRYLDSPTSWINQSLLRGHNLHGNKQRWDDFQWRKWKARDLKGQVDSNGPIGWFLRS